MAEAAAARRRAQVLTVLLAVTGVAWILSVPFDGIGVVAVIASALLGLDLAALVVSGRRRALRRRSAERARRREAALRRAATVPRRPATAASAPAPRTSAESGAPQPARAHPVAVSAAEAPAERVARELAGGGTPWVPVPVPPPTYTLKPAAPRPEPRPLDLKPEPPATELAEGTAASVPASGGTTADAAGASTPGVSDAAPRTPRPWDADRTFADDLDLDAVLARRRAVNG